MATFKICVFEHQKRATDNKYPVSIRVYWKGQSCYIGTEYYVTDKQVTHKKVIVSGKKKEVLLLKDIFIINELNKRIAKFEDLKSKKLGHRIDNYTAKELSEYFSKEIKTGSDTSINFVEFSRNYIAKLRNQNRKSTAGNLNRTVNAIVDFCNGRERIAITEITYKFLSQFEGFLKSERTIKRKNQFGKEIAIKRGAISDVRTCTFQCSNGRV